MKEIEKYDDQNETYKYLEIIYKLCYEMLLPSQAAAVL